ARRRVALLGRPRGRPRPGAPLRRVAPRLEPSCERRRREVARDPSGVDDAQAAIGRRARRRRHRAGIGAPLGRNRVGRRPDLGPGAGAVSYQDPFTIQSIINRAKTVAIVGLSPNELRASYFVGYYLRRHGFQVIPVNPREESILGVRSYPSLSEVPEHVDIVDVFRAPDAVPAIATEAVAVGAGALWLQYGVISPEGAEIAERG